MLGLGREKQLKRGKRMRRELLDEMVGGGYACLRDSRQGPRVIWRRPPTIGSCPDYVEVPRYLPLYTHMKTAAGGGESGRQHSSEGSVMIETAELTPCGLEEC